MTQDEWTKRREFLREQARELLDEAIQERLAELLAAAAQAQEIQR